MELSGRLKAELRKRIKQVDKAAEAMSLANGVTVSREMLLRKILADFHFAKAAVAIEGAESEVIEALEKMCGPEIKALEKMSGPEGAQ